MTGTRHNLASRTNALSGLRSQERPDDQLSLTADGILLYPAIGLDVDEAALIQAHRMRFVTIDLARPTGEVIERLRVLPIQSANGL